jgi:hypothetical protein
MQSAHAAQDEADPTPITAMSDQMEAETEPAWSDIMARIKTIVDSAESLPALRDALLAAYGDLPTDDLAEVMAMGMAAAHLAGRFDVQQEATGG